MKVDLKEALKLVQAGEVVAIPTETVYGLGASISSHEGLQQIFSVKERPFFDPLIVHVDSLESARNLSADWTEAHEILAKSCWPGPLTLITAKKTDLDSLITSGLDSVGLRCPRHNLTLQLLKELGTGLAAPSANKFGKTSPTSADHVLKEFAGQVPVLDGGPCEVGIESTVAGIKRDGDNYLVEIYRPGYFTPRMLEDLLKPRLKATVRYAESPVAPGQLKHHYMPKIPLVVAHPDFTWPTHRQQVEKNLGRTFKDPMIWEQPGSPMLAARELYQKMRDFEEFGFDIIITIFHPEHHTEDWKGIWNRLLKAKSLQL